MLHSCPLELWDPGQVTQCLWGLQIRHHAARTVGGSRGQAVCRPDQLQNWIPVLLILSANWGELGFSPWGFWGVDEPHAWLTGRTQ